MKVFLVIVVLIIVVVAGLYFIQKSKEQAIAGQVALMEASSRSQDACSKNWLCATQGLIGTVTDVLT